MSNYFFLPHYSVCNNFSLARAASEDYAEVKVKTESYSYLVAAVLEIEPCQ